MSKFLVLAGAAAVVAVAVGAFAILTPRPTGNLGPGAVAPAPTPTSTPSATAAPTATPAPSEVAPGITGWTPFTSEVYGVTFSLPDGWRQVDAATRRWRASDQGKETDEQIYDVLLNPSDRDGEDIAMLAYQRLAGSGADITSREGLAAWVEANLCGEYDPGQDPAQACYVVEPMCVGKTACRPAILVSDPGSVPESSQMPRPAWSPSSSSGAVLTFRRRPGMEVECSWSNRS